MSGPKRWVSSKVHRKASSKSSFSSSSPLDDDGLPPSPPTRLPREDSTTAATSIVDFASGSTLTTQGPGGSPGTIGSNSSIDSMSTGLTQSPSTTPPKKSWEKDYKSFLKRSGKHSKTSLLAAALHQTVPGTLPKPRQIRSFSENATAVLSKVHQHQSIFPSTNNEDFGPSLADGFEDHSQHSCKELETSTSNRSTIDGNLVGPPSPSKHKGSALFKRLRTKTKSVDNLDGTMRKGVDRKSPTSTPPSSVHSTPTTKRSSFAAVKSLQDGLEKAAMLNDMLSPPTLTSTDSLGSHTKQKSGLAPISPNLIPVGESYVTPLNDVNPPDNNLDLPRHRGHTISLAPSVIQTQPPTTSTTPKLFSRVQSMGSNLDSNLIIPEGEPLTPSKEEELIREKRKAFTDFHNMGVDSSSAYLGDDSSLHRHSVFLSSMAYPAGSAGGTGEPPLRIYCNILFLQPYLKHLPFLLPIL